jgi:hypothetical protein
LKDFWFSFLQSLFSPLLHILNCEMFCTHREYRDHLCSLKNNATETSMYLQVEKRNITSYHLWINGLVIYLKGGFVFKAIWLRLLNAPLPSCPCATLGLWRVPTKKKNLTRCGSSTLGLPVLQKHELNKPLFFINYPICGFQL